MTCLLLWQGTDELHVDLGLPGSHSVVEGCEYGAIDLQLLTAIFLLRLS